jgi:hypothetical protein
LSTLPQQSANTDINMVPRFETGFICLQACQEFKMMGSDISGDVEEVVGLSYNDRGRQCASHMTCGESLMLGDTVVTSLELIPTKEAWGTKHASFCVMWTS